jgi:hypothetical protein
VYRSESGHLRSAVTRQFTAGPFRCLVRRHARYRQRHAAAPSLPEQALDAMRNSNSNSRTSSRRVDLPQTNILCRLE